MRNTPLVSVGVPTRNRAAMLTRALDSLLGQDYDALEIIVSDNASDDDTPSLCRGFCERDDRVQYSRNEQDLGALANFSKVLELSRGEYFMWAADDDWLEPGFVSAVVGVLEADVEVALAAAEARYVLDDGRMLPFFAEGERFYETKRTSLVGWLIDVVDHNYGNLFYGIYRRSALTDGRSNVLSCITATTLNEIPIYLQVVAHGGIRVLSEQLLYKTTTLPTYRQAAAEYGWVLEEEAGAQLSLRNDPSLGRGSRDDPPASRLVTTWSAQPGFHESCVRQKPYHDEALRDIVAALLLVPLTPVDRLLVSEYCRLRIYEHLFELAAKEPGVLSPRAFWGRLRDGGWRSIRL